MDIVTRLSKVVKDCPDFPREGILFKDIMPIFNDPDLVRDTCQSLVDQVTRIPYWNMRSVLYYVLWFLWSYSQLIGLKIICICLLSSSPNFVSQKSFLFRLGLWYYSKFLPFNMWLWVEIDFQFIVFTILLDIALLHTHGKIILLALWVQPFEFWIFQIIHSGERPDVIIGIEARGFLIGPIMAQQLKIPFVPIRKKGKLPRECYSVKYEKVHSDLDNFY